MQEFHACEDVEHLVKISRNFEDDRYRILAERIICSNYDADIPSDVQERYLALTHERTQTDGKWGSIEKSLNDIEKLLNEKEDKEDQIILKATKEKLLSMKQ